MNDLDSPCGDLAIDDFLAGKFDETEQVRWEDHLDSCDRCCERLAARTAETERWDEVRRGLSGTTIGKDGGSESSAVIPNLDFLAPSDDPRMLGRFAGYEIAGVVGMGGMGIVLKGFDAALNRYVAIKVLAPHFANSGAARSRFAREAQAAAAVVHDNVVAIHGVCDGGRGLPGQQSGLPHLVMPYIRGESLQRRVDRGGPLAPAEILRIAMQVARGLAAAHDQGLVHRDIKPANLLLPEDIERVLITDFGLARAADDASLTRSGVIAGTPQYMSPEQATGDPITPASDLFSLGSVMYTMATARVPFRAETPLGVLRRIVDGSPKPVRDLNPDIPDWLCRIIESLHAKLPGDRPASADQIADLLQQCLAHVQKPDQIDLPPAITPEGTAEGVTQGAVASDSSFPFSFHPLIFVSVLMVSLPIALWFLVVSTDVGLSEAESHAADRNKIASSVRVARDGLTRRQLAFPDRDRPGILKVSLRRGSISVKGHDGDEVWVEYQRRALPDSNFKVENEGTSVETASKSGRLRPIATPSIQWDVDAGANQISLDAENQYYSIDVTIRVPRRTDLDLDTYYDGFIRVDGVRGRFELRSQNSDITLVSTAGSGKLYGYNGTMRAELVELTGDLSIESYNGDVDLSLPADTRATLGTRGNRGQIFTDLPLVRIDASQVKSIPSLSEVDEIEAYSIFRLDGGGPSVRLETQKGEITIRQTSMRALSDVALVDLPDPTTVAVAVPNDTDAQTDTETVIDIPANPSPPYPVLISTVPAMGATDVDPSINEVRITFDRDMSQGMSWTGRQLPVDRSGKPRWIDDRTCALPVKLERGKVYRVGVNSKSFQNFRSTDGKPTPPIVIAFATEGASDEMKETVKRPSVISFSPANGAVDVDPDIIELMVTFDRPMAAGMSWTIKRRDSFPKLAAGKKPYWSGDGTVCTLPVRLESDKTYQIGINDAWNNQFQSRTGIPCEPMTYRFKTR